MSEIVLFACSVVVSGLLLFSSIYFIVMMADLECDYINPIDLCKSLNKYALTDMAVQCVLFLLFVVCSSWIAALIQLPLFVFHCSRILKKNYLFDPTEIFRTLSAYKRVYAVKAVFHVFCFFYFLYRMVAAIAATHPLANKA
ncbi:cornichon [Spinellus fusiger]|nr:cornichon [Spinellus fusiger]